MIKAWRAVALLCALCVSSASAFEGGKRACADVRTLPDQVVAGILTDLWGDGGSPLEICLAWSAMVRGGLLSPEVLDTADLTEVSGELLYEADAAGAPDRVRPELAAFFAERVREQIAVNSERGVVSLDPAARPRPIYTRSDADSLFGFSDIRAGSNSAETADTLPAAPAVGSVAGQASAQTDAPPTDGLELAGDPVTGRGDGLLPRPMPQEFREARIAADSALRARGCLDLTAERDPDVRRNLGLLLSFNVCLTKSRVGDPGHLPEWVFAVYENSDSPDGPVWYLPHDNEDSAFTAAAHAIKTYGGKFFTVNAREQRLFSGVDPNRAFALSDGDVRNCQIRRPLVNYTQFVLDQFGSAAMILTLHNNTDGGGVSVNVNNAKETGLQARVNRGMSDPDHLIYVAGTTRLNNDERLSSLVDALRDRGINIVHERVSPGNFDCSLSNYVALRMSDRLYFNIEAQHGFDGVQANMIDALIGAIRDQNI